MSTSKEVIIADEETEMSLLHSRQHYFGRLKTRTETTTTTKMKRPKKERT